MDIRLTLGYRHIAASVNFVLHIPVSACRQHVENEINQAASKRYHDLLN